MKSVSDCEIRESRYDKFATFDSSINLAVDQLAVFENELKTH